MYFLLTDETNRFPSDAAPFFVYGGLVFPVDVLDALHSGIESIRKEVGYRAADQFKFDTRSRPDHISREDATDAKRMVLQLCLQLECKFIVHVILHDVIANQDGDQQLQWAADYVIGRFNQYLHEVGDEGICIVDNLPNRSEFRYLANKFTTGLTLDSGTRVQLDRIKLFASTCIGASHVASAMDIVLGSFRYCINDPANITAAAEMLRQVTVMMWNRKVDNKLFVRGRGLILRPKLSEIRVKEYRQKYEDLIDQLKELSVLNEAVD